MPRRKSSQRAPGCTNRCETVTTYAFIQRISGRMLQPVRYSWVHKGQLIHFKKQTILSKLVKCTVRSQHRWYILSTVRSEHRWYLPKTVRSERRWFILSTVRSKRTSNGPFRLRSVQNAPGYVTCTARTPVGYIRIIYTYLCRFLFKFCFVCFLVTSKKVLDCTQKPCTHSHTKPLAKRVFFFGSSQVKSRGWYIMFN